MGFSTLIFRDSFMVTASYDRAVQYFKTRLDRNYFKGYIGHEQVQLFYSSHDPRSFSLRSHIPLIQLNIVNEKLPDGKMKIRIKVVDPILIFFAIGFLIAALVYFLIQDKNILFVLLFGLPFFYILILVNYRLELDHFKKEIQVIEDFYAKAPGPI